MSLAKVFRIGDTVKVKVTHVDVDERMIDFQIVGLAISQSSSQRPARGKTIQAKTRGKAFRQIKNDGQRRKNLRSQNSAKVKMHAKRKKWSNKSQTILQR